MINHKLKNIKSPLIEALFLLLFCLIFGITANKISPRGIPLFRGQWDPAKGTMHAGGPCAPKNQEMDITALSHLMEKLKDSLVIVDARSQEEYREGHIPGAISLPLGEVNYMIDDFLSSVSPDKMIVTYCAGVECYDSHELAEILNSVGYAQVQVFAGGFPEWVEQHKAVDTDKD
jgi:rhodanese-related sulfurtransferase